MDIKMLVLIFLCIGNSLFAQQAPFKASNVKGADSKSDSLPYFIYLKQDLDTFLLNNEIISAAEERWGVNVYVSASFLVDSAGKPTNIIVHKVDIKLNSQTKYANEHYSDTITKYYSQESARLINLTEGMWVASQANSKHRLSIIIPYRSEAYDEKNQKRLETKYDSRGRVIYEPTTVGDVKSVLNVYHYYDFGVQKLNEGKLLIAERYFEQALKVKRDDLDAWYNLGICFFKEKKREKACDAWMNGWKLGDKGAQELLEKYCK
jgi:tetratricopeptide (TPR) repeat protein